MESVLASTVNEEVREELAKVRETTLGGGLTPPRKENAIKPFEFVLRIPEVDIDQELSVSRDTPPKSEKSSSSRR